MFERCQAGRNILRFVSGIAWCAVQKHVASFGWILLTEIFFYTSDAGQPVAPSKKL